MKYFLIFGLLVCSSCLEKDEKQERYWGDISAIKNGHDWTAEIYTGENEPHNQGVDIVVRKFNQKRFLREGLHFFKIPFKVGVYQLSTTDVRTLDDLIGASYGTFQDDGGGGDSYFLSFGLDIENKIEITEIKGNEIKGTFQASFIKDLRFGEADPSAPDTIVFVDGKFHTRMFE